MRVLIVAENASAKFGGEAFLPLHYFRMLRSRHIEAWLVTHARTQAELEALLPEERDRMFFVPDTWLHRWLFQCGQLLPRRIGEATTGQISHLYTQTMQRRLVRHLVQEHQIDIVHEPIPVSPKSPSLMFDVGAPVAIGPMNGGMEFPPAFRSHESRWVRVIIGFSRQCSHWFNRILPGKLKADTLLVANDRTRRALPAGVQGKVIELVENGVDLSVWRAPSSTPKAPNQPVRFAFVGRLVDWKAVDLLLEAFVPVAAQTGAILEIIGDGGVRSQLEAQATSLGIERHTIFAGWLPQEQCAARLRQADALVLPSLFECGGAVILEAMAMGLPAIATHWGGPADYIDSTCGILVEPTSREAFIQGLTDAMLKLAQFPELRLQMGRAGLERVREHFNWERKTDQILEVYQDAIATSQKQPQI